jgi:hypothetical protein
LTLTVMVRRRNKDYKVHLRRSSRRHFVAFVVELQTQAREATPLSARGHSGGQAAD